MNLLLAIIGLLFSFFFAGSEAAFTRFNKVRLEIWYRQGKPLSKNAHYFVQHPDRFFSTILIGNNLANTLCTTFTTVLLIQYLGESTILLSIGFVILLFGEVIPKSLFQAAADRIILYVLIMVRGFYRLLAPLIKIINFASEFILKVLRVRHESINAYFAREEFELLLSNQSTASKGQDEQLKYIDKVLSFNLAQVREVMTPRMELISIDINSEISEALKIMQDISDPFLVVHKNDLDDIIGVIFLYDMFLEKTELRELIKPLNIVPENKSCIDTFDDFQRNNVSVSLVVDEYGGTAGIVTMDDLLEEILGEFLEPQEAPLLLKKLNQNTWLLDAHINIEDICLEAEIVIPEGEYETVAGFILWNTGKIPLIDEMLHFNDFRIKIIEATQHKIQRVQIIKNKNFSK